MHTSPRSASSTRWTILPKGDCASRGFRAAGAARLRPSSGRRLASASTASRCCARSATPPRRSTSSSPRALPSTAAEHPRFPRRRELCEGCAAEEVSMHRLPLHVLIAASAVAAAAPAAEKLEQPKVTIAVGGRGLFYYLPLTLADRL